MSQRGRKAIEVNINELQKQISQLESSQPEGKFANRTALWTALADSEWAKSRSPRPLTGQVAMMLAKNANMIIATPLGRRGREKGSGPVNTTGRRRKVMPAYIVKSLKQVTAPSLHPVVDRAANGSMKAAIKLKCIDCCCGQKKEIALCPLTSCPLYHFRPYKRLAKDGTTTTAVLSGQTSEDS